MTGVLLLFFFRGVEMISSMVACLSHWTSVGPSALAVR